MEGRPSESWKKGVIRCIPQHPKARVVRGTGVDSDNDKRTIGDREKNVGQLLDWQNVLST